MGDLTTPGPNGPDDETCLKAWDERVKGKSPPHIAELFRVSVPTINRWIKKGRELAEVVEYEEKIAHPAGNVNMRSELARQVATTDLVIEWMGQYVDQGGDHDKAALVVLKALERRAAATGSDPPKRIAVRDDRAPRAGAAVPRGTTAAIEAYDRGEDPVDDDGGAGQ